MKASDSSFEMSSVPVADPGLSHLRVFGFALACALPFVLAWDLMRVLVSLFGNDTFSQVPLIPLVSLFLIYSNGGVVFSEVSFGWSLGATLIVPGVVCIELARLNLWQLTVTNQVSLLVFGMVLSWVGAFALFFGTRAFQAARFPLVFLVFTIPIPEPVLSKVIAFLQEGSTDLANAFFELARVPHFRQGFVIELPGVAIRVAEECSGIRSTLALLITAVLASHFFLRRNWKRLLLILIVVPLAIFKNGLRIATLSILAIYVNPGFLHGNLHHDGGIIFFVIALLPMAFILRLLQKSGDSRADLATRS
jgi:exosortase